MRIPYITLCAAGALVLGGCAYDMYGSPYGYGYGPYSGVSVGISSGYGGYGGYYGGYGGYDPYYSPFGWYGDYYYPGSGVYVYDSYRRPHMWTSGQRSYWTTRGDTWRSRHHDTAVTTTTTSQNWSGFDRRRDTDGTRRHRH
jgi:hypothetical protein